MKIKKRIIAFTLIIVSLVCLVGCSVTMYKVTFDSNGGSNVSSKSTMGYVARPTEPTKDGYTFAGWYLDQECSQEFDFKNKISEDVTLYAKWVEAQDQGGNKSGDDSGSGQQSGDNSGSQGEDPNTNTGDNGNQTPTEYTIKFETNGGGEIPDCVTSSKVTKPRDPDRENYRFDGWFTDSELTSPFDFNTTVTSSFTLYAKWTHIDYVAYVEGTFNDDPIDPYILAMDFSSRVVNNSDEYGLYLDYAVLNKLDSLELTLTTPIESNEDFSAFVNGGMDKMKVETTCHFDFHIVGNTLTTSFTYPEQATVSASDTNAYNQVPFVCYHKASTREADFTGFKINSVTNTYMVTDSDQLCYVLEHGYKPVFSSETCQAKKMYDKACEALISICDDTFTDIEKLHAIYDWLIENITYDGVLFDKVVANQSDLKKYKGFYLEGVFDDHRAVCDGISKAFMVMARIEGIECVQVSGTSKQTGVGHAWNKVRLDNRWYIVDATGGGIIVSGTNEMLTHRLFMCNDAYYSQKYTASEYTDFVADSGYSIYFDLTFTYEDTEHDYYIEDTDELACLLAYYASLNDNTKSIDFYYAGENVSAALSVAMQKAHIYKAYTTVNSDGSIIYKLSN